MTERIAPALQYARPKNYHTVQALRGLAAMAVMLYHFHTAFNLPSFPLGDYLFKRGDLGVSLFFVISGFVMGLPTYKSGMHSAWEFAAKRLARIAPLYLIATVVWCYVSIPGFSPVADILDLIKAAIFYPLGSSPAPVYGAKLFVGWTLNYEMLFYAVLAIGILVGRPWVVLAVFFLSTLWVRPTLDGALSWDPFVEYGYRVGYLRLASNPIVWNFLIGVLAARALRIIPSIGREAQIMLCAFVSIAVAWQLFSGYNSGFGLVQSGAGFAILVFAFAWYEKCHGAAVVKPLIFLGNISFSLYIWHFVLHVWLSEYLTKIGMLEYSRGFLYGLTVSALSIVVARISYLLIEQRLSNWVRDLILSTAPGRHADAVDQAKA
ncbi:acyltransferase family protein [Ralstonia sp. Ralssp135]|uniref:acyltransferase family protein n=1 Tax=Ralstonia sp. Ralssp135 TaxID=3243016 RepID=UPI0039B09504